MSEELGVLNLLQGEVDKIRTRMHDLVSEVSNQKLQIVKIEDRMEDRKPCDLHVSSMKEFNDSITRIELINNKTQGQLEGFMNLANSLILKIERDVYKDGGLITKAANNANQIILQWGIIGVIFIAALGLFLWRK